MDSINKRRHFRVEMVVPVKWQVLNKEEIELVKGGMAETLCSQKDLPGPIKEFVELASPGSKEEQLYRSLQYINNKLDYIIDQVRSSAMESQPIMDDIIDISASGLKFLTREHLDTNTLLKMTLIMPGTFQYQMNLIAEVLRVEEEDIGFIVAARIVQIDEDARNSIVNVVFQKQRNDIRKEKINQEENNGG